MCKLYYTGLNYKNEIYSNINVGWNQTKIKIKNKI